MSRGCVPIPGAVGCEPERTPRRQIDNCYVGNDGAHSDTAPYLAQSDSSARGAFGRVFSHRSKAGTPDMSNMALAVIHRFVSTLRTVIESSHRAYGKSRAISINARSAMTARKITATSSRLLRVALGLMVVNRAPAGNPTTTPETEQASFISPSQMITQAQPSPGFRYSQEKVSLSCDAAIAA